MNCSSAADASQRRGYSLHIGINEIDAAHYGSAGELVACEADAHAMHGIAKAMGYTESRLLLSEQATRDAVQSSISAIAEKMNGDDIFFLSYAGHGAQIPDMNPNEADDERDGKDETLCLYDAQLIDDELYLLWRQFPPGSRILMVSDSCHSETQVRAGPGGLIEHVKRDSAAIAQGEPAKRLLPPRQANHAYTNNKAFYLALFNELDQRTSSGPLTVSIRLLSGCQDNQVSMDGATNGAFTTQLLHVWNEGKYTRSYKRFHQDIQKRMPDTQSPQHTEEGIRNSLFDAQSPFAI